MSTVLQSNHPSIHQSIHPSIYTYIESIHLFISPYVQQAISHSVCPSLQPHIYPNIHPNISFHPSSQPQHPMFQQCPATDHNMHTMGDSDVVVGGGGLGGPVPTDTRCNPPSIYNPSYPTVPQGETQAD